MDVKSLILENEKLIYKIAGYFKDYISIEDLYQAGCIGIIKASKNYQNDKNTKFTTYAYSYILGEMKELVREEKPLKISKEILSLRNKIEKAKVLLTQKLMHEPTNEELSLFLEIPISRVDEILNSNIYVSSIDDGYGDTNMLMHEIISSPNIDADALIMLKESIETLEEPERSIMIERYYKDMTQSEVAEDLGLKQTFVSRREQKVLQKLRQRV